eukprot:85850-Chlamydomonas_euryale.AAC.2
MLAGVSRRDTWCPAAEPHTNLVFKTSKPTPGRSSCSCVAHTVSTEACWCAPVTALRFGPGAKEPQEDEREGVK